MLKRRIYHEHLHNRGKKIAAFVELLKPFLGRRGTRPHVVTVEALNDRGIREENAATAVTTSKQRRNSI